VDCEQLTIPLNSCSLVWADPNTTLPKGRLQGHVRTHPTGSLKEICPTDDCDNCGRGLAICVRGEDVCDDLESPPTCVNDDGTDRFKNALRRDVNGCLWVDVRRVFAGVTPERTPLTPAAGLAPASGGLTFATETTSYENKSCFDQKVRVDICINNAVIGGPTPSDSGPAQIEYQIVVDGTVYNVFCSAGEYECQSTVVCVGLVDLSAGDTLTNSLEGLLNYSNDAGGDFPYSSGEITVIYTPMYDLDPEDC